MFACDVWVFIIKILKKINENEKGRNVNIENRPKDKDFLDFLDLLKNVSSKEVIRIAI